MLPLQHIRAQNLLYMVQSCLVNASRKFEIFICKQGDTANIFAEWLPKRPKPGSRPRAKNGRFRSPYCPSNACLLHSSTCHTGHNGSVPYLRASVQILGYLEGINVDSIYFLHVLRKKSPTLFWQLPWQPFCTESWIMSPVHWLKLSK